MRRSNWDDYFMDCLQTKLGGNKFEKNAQKTIIFMILNKGQRNTRHTNVIDVDMILSMEAVGLGSFKKSLIEQNI